MFLLIYDLWLQKKGCVVHISYTLLINFVKFEDNVFITWHDYIRIPKELQFTITRGSSILLLSCLFLIQSVTQTASQYEPWVFWSAAPLTDLHHTPVTRGAVSWVECVAEKKLRTVEAINVGVAPKGPKENHDTILPASEAQPANCNISTLALLIHLLLAQQEWPDCWSKYQIRNLIK